MAKKKTKVSLKAKKETVQTSQSSSNSKVIWVFDQIDRAGKFAFDTSRKKFNHKVVLDKMISYSGMTWSEVLSQTHDDGKSKNHLLDYEKLSREAKERIDTLKLNDDNDRIFSFALLNKLRIIGLRDKEKFFVKWYDPWHEFYPSTKK